MNKRYEELISKYKEFSYNSYDIKEDTESIYLSYEFEIKGLTKFNPEIKILKKNLKLKDINSDIVKNMVFNIGLIELISYWKCTCSPLVYIKCGLLTEEQVNWWKHLYFNGLGEFFYRNELSVDAKTFMDIKSVGERLEFDSDNDEKHGYIVPIGGGKDSCVTLETLDIDFNNDYALIINPKETTLKCASIAGFNSSNIIEIYRSIDTNLIELNNQGFLNGHTPFSAMLAFYSYFIGYLTNKKYIALSNEGSANESNIIGTNINHQYSKSIELENNFRSYAKLYLKSNVEYFSFLRPLNELQIAKIFSKHEKYHEVFKSCNVGSKTTPWKWCNNCAKCLFAYIILSPYLYKDKLINIFKEDLYEKKELLETFLELLGKKDIKPFDCVGTFEEVNYAVQVTIKNLERDNISLPYLLKFYKDNYNIELKEDITRRFNSDNNLSELQINLLKKEVLENE